jgi:hypothetical protein
MKHVFLAAIIVGACICNLSAEDHEGKITRIIAITDNDPDQSQRGDIRLYLNDNSSYWKIRSTDLSQKAVLAMALSAQASGLTVHFETSGAIGTFLNRLWIVTP